MLPIVLGFSLAMASRLGASLELLKSEFTRGIDGSADIAGQTVQGVINAGRTLIQGVLEVGPVVWHSIAGALGQAQEFIMQERNGVMDGIGNAVGNTITELRNGKFLSAIYTLFSEIVPDSFVRDGIQGHTIQAVPQS